MTTAERTCLTCGQPFTVPARIPRKRFCSDRCRTAHWHAHHDRPGSVESTENAVTNAVPPDHTVPNAAPPENAVPNGVPAANGVQHCPHCHGELAIIAVLVPANAAHIRAPEVNAMHPS